MNPKSKQLFEKARRVIIGGVSRNTVFRLPYPDYAANAKGCYITDIDGKKYIDFANNMAALIHGHAFPPVIEAVTKQLQKGTAYTLASEIELEFAAHLKERVDSFERIKFMNSGTEAVMAMIKASRAYTGRSKIAKAEGAYHGTYDYAEVSQTANPNNWGELDSPNSVPVAYGTPKSALDEVVVYPYNDIERTLAILEKNADEIACVIVDPVPHRIGLMEGNEEFVEAIYHWTREKGALMVFDEVVTLRVNYGGAQENYSVPPDLTAMGKIIGGGFPVGALAGRAEIMSVFDNHRNTILYPHAGTFSANPITMTAGYKAMEYFDEISVMKLNEITEKAKSQIEEAIRLVDVPVSLTGAGSMFRVHLKAKAPTTYRETYQNDKEKALIKELLDYLYYQENILMINTCSCMLSTVTGKKEIDRLSEGFERGLKLLKPKIENLNNF
jgi:glutamate-1-semialdehyde 2,1-aminomutase